MSLLDAVLKGGHRQEAENFPDLSSPSYPSYPEMVTEVTEETIVEESFSGPAARCPGPLENGWPPESLEAKGRFAQPRARLFPFLGRKVRTPAGAGTLLQVFADRATVLLDSELGKCRIFPPCEIEPISKEWLE